MIRIDSFQQEQDREQEQERSCEHDSNRLESCWLALGLALAGPWPGPWLAL